jgi:2-dehydropantoate 2-reductase
MRFAVFGVGGAGGYFGARLAQAGHEVVLIARGAHLEAIRRDGLRVETPDGEIAVSPVLATDMPAAAGVADVVLLGVKAWQVREAGDALRPLLGPHSCVVTLQNGVEAAEQLAQVLGAGCVLPGICGTFSRVVAPGRIRTISASNLIRFGEVDDRPSGRTERLRAALDRPGITVEIPPDITAALWEKFLFVSALGGVGALARRPLGVLRAMPETRRLLEACMTEVLAVGLARGVALRPALVTETMALVDRLPPEGTTSLQRDLQEGRPSELDAWNGAVVRLGRGVGVATPVNEIVYASQLPAERQARGLPLEPDRATV